MSEGQDGKTPGQGLGEAGNRWDGRDGRGRFQKDVPSPHRGSRPRGSRNKLAENFLADLSALWEEQGECEPVRYVNERFVGGFSRISPNLICIVIGDFARSGQNACSAKRLRFYLPSFLGKESDASVEALPRARQSGWPRPAVLQHRGDGVASPRDRARRATRRPRRAVRGSGGLARHREAKRVRKHDARPAAVQIARAQSSREHLAIHARQLALQPDLQKLRRHRRSLLLQLEQTGCVPMVDNVNRNARLGSVGGHLRTWY